MAFAGRAREGRFKGGRLEKSAELIHSQSTSNFVVRRAAMKYAFVSSPPVPRDRRELRRGFHATAQIQYNRERLNYNDLGGPPRPEASAFAGIGVISGLPIRMPCNEACFFAARRAFWEFIRRPIGVAQEWMSLLTGT